MIYIIAYQPRVPVGQSLTPKDGERDTPPQGGLPLSIDRAQTASERASAIS
jgi:hypothetical protein